MENDNFNDHIAKYSNEQFDKNVLFIASGSLGISFAFIKDVVNDFENAVSKNALITSWAIFASVIFISLISQFIVARACDWSYKNQNLDTNIYNCKVLLWNIPIRILNFTSILALFVGVLILIYFIKQNI